MIEMRLLLAAILSLSAACASTATEVESVAICPSSEGVTLQVLGSGGPIADDARASSGYLIWIDGKSRVLIDAGGGTFLRFGEAAADFKQLDFIGLSHFHTDHSADFPALLKSGSFAGRKRPLAIAGPSGSDLFPGLDDYLNSMLARQQGAYGYLGGFLDGSGGMPKLGTSEIDKDNIESVRVFASEGGDITIDALPVPHGIVPAVAFRVTNENTSMVFASDQNGGNDNFIEFAKDANVLVMHMVIPEGTTGTGRRLHAPPSVIGTIARKANVGTLVLSHFMARSLQNLDENIALVKQQFDGGIILAHDLGCIAADKT
jgi:ribonuclease BN (tRNA processing enzyme)